jgi:hypothetical protein
MLADAANMNSNIPALKKVQFDSSDRLCSSRIGGTSSEE